jgi:hypothetical protein
MVVLKQTSRELVVSINEVKKLVLSRISREVFERRFIERSSCSQLSRSGRSSTVINSIIVLYLSLICGLIKDDLYMTSPVLMTVFMKMLATA